MVHKHEHDPDSGKGAVEEQDARETSQSSLAGQLPHRTDNEMIKANDTDFPEPGPTAEHSGQRQVADADADPEMKKSGERQKNNQNDQQVDPLAS